MTITMGVTVIIAAIVMALIIWWKRTDWIVKQLVFKQQQVHDEIMNLLEIQAGTINRLKSQVNDMQKELDEYIKNPTPSLKNNHMAFEEWYAELCHILRAKGYSKAPDWDTAKDDFDHDKAVSDSADEFAEEWGDPGDEEID